MPFQSYFATVGLHILLFRINLNKMTRVLVIVFSILISTTYAQQRIVTAGSSSTEIVCALGFCDKIVASDRTSLYPQMIQNLPSIGYRSAIGAEGVISQKPDLIFFEKDYVKDDVITQLKSARLKTVVLEHEQNFESTKQRIRTIASALSVKDQGEALIKKIESGLSELQKKVAKTTSRPKVLCVYNRGAGNMMVAGENTSFGLLPLAGTANAVSGVEGYKPLNTEYLIKSDPEYILFFTSGLESIGGIEEALKIPGVEQTTAGKTRQIIAMDGILLTNWGPRIAEAANQLFELTHNQPK